MIQIEFDISLWARTHSASQLYIISVFFTCFVSRNEILKQKYSFKFSDVEILFFFFFIFIRHAAKVWHFLVVIE